MSASSFFDESLVLPRALEILARDYPETTWATVPKRSDLTEGWRSITYGELGHAVDGFASWAQSTLGASDVVAYMGVHDVKYAVAEIGAIKTGRTILLPSPRNSSQESVALFAAVGCTTLVHSESMVSKVAALKSAIPTLQTLRIPSFDDLSREGARIAYAGQYSVEEDAPAIILQTSGSTGSPRPIKITHGGIATFKHVSDFSLSAKFNSEDGAGPTFGKTMFSMAPFFHESGTIFVTRSILCKGPIVLPPSDRPATAELILDILSQTKPSIAALFPSVLEDLVQLPGGLDALAGLDMVSFGGAPLARETGDKICEVTFLYSGIGSTEAGVLATELPRDKKDWNYCAWAPISGVEMQSRDDGLHEAVIKPVDRKYQRIFHTYPGITEYRTKDLFQQHPYKKGLWTFKGRADDTIVLSNGEKFNPVDVEKRLELHPSVNGALIVGQDRFQTGLLIEPAWDLVPPGAKPADILKEVWPLIEEINHGLPKHGVLWKSKIAITSKDRPFVRTSTKGNIIRSKSTGLYAAEIQALYDDMSLEEAGSISHPLDLGTIESKLRSIAQDAGILMSSDIANDHDLFALGMDSLQALHLASMIKSSLGRTISTANVYKYPTIDSLAAFLATKNQSVKAADPFDHAKDMKDMIKKYTDHMTPRTAPQLAVTSDQGQFVVLTGSTGNLGCLILQELIKAPDFKRIFSLNRAIDGETRQSREFEDRGLKIDFSKVTFLHSKDFGQDQLGLSSSAYQELLENVDVVILNAWIVDFNKTLRSFESLVAGVRKFVDFSTASQHRAHIVMISSVASVGNWPSICEATDLEVPEQIIEDNRAPAPSGYGESKHVAALVLAAAAEVGVTSTVIRVGQLAGATQEYSKVQWSDREWVPNMLATSKVLGLLPEQLGGLKSIDWVPIDLAARAIVEIAHAVPDTRNQSRVLHIVNPKPTTWNALLPAVQACLVRRLDKDVPIVPYATWLSKLRQVPNTRSNAENVPGIKLLDFYEGLAASHASLRLATTNAVLISPTMANLGPINAQLMAMWVEGMQ